MNEFKLIVAGGRDFNNLALLENILFKVAEELGADEVSLVSGMARGADLLAYQFAKKHNVQCYEFPADWEKHGKAAGFIRNKEMADFSHGLLAFWDGKSRGTKHMIDTMLAQQKPVSIVSY